MGNYDYIGLINLGKFSIPFLILSIGLLINATNYIDGVDGLLLSFFFSTLVYYIFLVENVELQNPKQIVNTYDDFDLGFENVHAVISYSSNPGIHAVINGTHAFVGPESLAYPVANKELKNIENPQIFDRNQWLYDYAYTEWTIEEIAKGLPFSRLTF